MFRATKGSALDRQDGTSESLVRIEILTLFHRNPGLVGSPEYLAEAIGRDLATVNEQAHKLAHLRILEMIQVEERTCYRYLPPPAENRTLARESRAKKVGSIF